MPAALLSETGEVQYNSKVPLGYKDGEEFFIYNHADMVIMLGPAPNKEETYRVVGFGLLPRSINHEKLRKKAQ